MTPDLQDLCALAGVRPGYMDQTGRYRETSAETARALLYAMGHAVGTETEIAGTLAALKQAQSVRYLPNYVVIAAGEPARIGARGVFDWALETETGETIEGHAEGAVDLPALPLGIHWLTAEGDACAVLSAPPSLPLPPRGWGVTLPLYGLWTTARGGLGDYGDLAGAVRAIGPHGAGFVGLNPIHAGFFPDPREYSPYAPSHRRRLNAAHLRVPGETGGGSGPLVDYPSAYRARRAALDAAWAAAEPGRAFEAFLAAEGRPLFDFATHQALSEVHGPFWRDWPESFRDPASPAVARFAAENAGRVRFHAWLQYLAESQLAEAAKAAAGMRFGLYLDVAVGTHPYGAETWLEPGPFARGVSIGAPPDAFSEGGQVWGLAPLNPAGLIASGFRQVAEMLRKQFQFSRLIRIDHILGFDRSFWVPEDPVLPGAYVSMPKDGLLAVARIEAARAGGTIIGEDLGNIPEGLHADLDASGLLGCRVAMFELNHHGQARAPEDYPEATLASFGTHDLPTFAGWRAARDIDAREALGSLSTETAERARAHRRWEVGRFDAVAGGGDAAAMERLLGRTRSRLVALQIEDILGVEDQPNLPGTVAEYPNWRRRLPVEADALGAQEGMARAAGTMAAAGR